MIIHYEHNLIMPCCSFKKTLPYGVYVVRGSIGLEKKGTLLTTSPTKTSMVCPWNFGLLQASTMSTQQSSDFGKWSFIGMDLFSRCTHHHPIMEINCTHCKLGN
eukprot:TRINITY_DN11160_c0_g2_i1.p1 TRINITY_DN11160_c0_g2~~TRINITY_DN11160_c0_g2_i1.p1  ORF type:complete len:104 (-),score=9.85 TRINITY_DN11160_c0_g2_i1:169-480(-)